MDGMTAWGFGQEEWVVRKAEEKGSLLHDLEDGALDRRGVAGVGERTEIEGDDGDAVGELLCVGQSATARLVDGVATYRHICGRSRASKSGRGSTGR